MTYTRRWDCENCGKRVESMNWPRKGEELCDRCELRRDRERLAAAVRPLLGGQLVGFDISSGYPPSVTLRFGRGRELRIAGKYHTHLRLSLHDPVSSSSSSGAETCRK